MITLSQGMAGGALALPSALMFAVAASLQQDSARSAALARGEFGTLAVLGIARTLLTSPRWLVGQVLSVAGFLCHAAALRYGPISTVQALLVMQLLFALPLAARRRRTGLLRRDWAGTVAVCSGLILLVAQDVPHGGVLLDRIPAAGAVVLGAVALLLAAGRAVAGPQLRSALTAMAAGCCFATTAVLVTVATSALPQWHWAWLGVPVSTVVGGILTQEAFARGSLPTALTTMTITDPVMSYAAGLTLFATIAPHPGPAGVLAAAAVVVGGVVLLANSPTLHDERDHREPDAFTEPVAVQDEPTS